MKATRGTSGVWRVLTRFLQIFAILWVALPFLGSTATQAGGVGDSPQGAAPGQDLPAGVTPEWWATVQAQIGEGEGGAGLGPGALPGVEDWSAPGALDGDNFGDSMAGAGDVNGDGYADVIVGAMGFPQGSSRGRAYAFYGSAAGLSKTADWTATGQDDGDLFGGCVAGAQDVNGDGYDDVVVGAIYGAEGKGQIYVYAGSPAGLSPTPSWTAQGPDASVRYAESVAGAGDVNGDGYHDIVVGASEAGETGQVYLYLGSPAGIGRPNWSASGEYSGDLFGYAVSGVGDVNGDGYADVAVGAPGYGPGQGAVYVFHGSATGLSATSAWTQIGVGNDDQFGYELAAAGDVNGDGYADLAVAARNTAGNTEGKAYLYAGSSSGLAATSIWTAVGVGSGDEFGRSVDSAGDLNGDGYADLVIGAPENRTSRGLVYVYHGSSTGPSASVDWLANGAVDLDRFGYAVAGAGDVNGDGFADIIAGAPGFPAGDWRGKAYGYYGGGDPPSFLDDWHQAGENAGDNYGFSVASAGDVNGNGYGDVIVGAFAYGALQGKAYAYYGSAAGLSQTPDWTAVGEQQGDRFGEEVASAGDVNGDGYADVVAGASGYPAGDYRGKVYLYYGGPAGLSALPDWVAEGEGTHDWYGQTAASAGDVNGDGYADLIVGAYGFGAGGKAYLYYGSATGLGASADWTAVGESNENYFGVSVAGAGDVNGDGYADVIISADHYQTGSWRGKVYVYHGGPSGPGSTADWSAVGEDDGDYFGNSVSTAGDVNRDGYADVVVGARWAPAPYARGKVYVYHGSPAGLSPSADWVKEGAVDWDRFGGLVATAGDADGDGFADLIVATEYYPASSNWGKAYLFPGGASGLASDPIWVAVGENDHARFGFSAASAGDVNGDGSPDVIVGAPGYPVESDPGKAFLYYGNQDQGRRVLARQVRGGGSGLLVQPWGLSHSGDRFVLRMWATHPMGRDRVKLEVQACPAGMTFGDAACIKHVSPLWRDVTASSEGVEFVETISGLDRDTLYRWRVRMLYAPFSVTEPGIVAPPNPAHGPWRRFAGQAMEADLRTATAWETYLPLVLRHYRPLYIVLGQDNVERGIQLDYGGDVDTEVVTVGSPPAEARRTGNGHVLPAGDGNQDPDFYMQFRVDDDALFAGDPTTRLRIEVRYFDQGTDRFRIEYDALSGGPYGDGTFKGTGSVVKTDTGQFRTAIFDLDDAYFGNRDNGADFRLDDESDGAEIIRRVTIQRLPPGPWMIHVDSCGANPWDANPDSDAIQACVDRAWNGDTVFFTSGVNSPGYQGYLIDKTVFLVATSARQDLTFTSTDPANHALLHATGDLKGFVVRLYARSRVPDPGDVDDITVSHLDLHGGRDLRVCYGTDGIENGVDDHWGSWLPECSDPGDPWCSAGGLGLDGLMDWGDTTQDYLANPSLWGTGLVVDDLTIAQTECGTALSMGGAANTIRDTTIETAGDHVHVAGCAQTDGDGELEDWSDGITFTGPGHLITGNSIGDASDVGIVFFGGRDTVISGNTVQANSGNYGMFAAIAVHPWIFGDVSGVQVVDNQVDSSASSVCGGIHAGINIGTHMWGGGCIANANSSTIGNPQLCTADPPPPAGTLCTEDALCQVWAHVGPGETFTLQGNHVTGAQVNYLIEGLDLMGTLVESGNVSTAPAASDWEDDAGCWMGGEFDSWDRLAYAAHHPTLPGWTDQRIHCTR